MHHPGPSRQRHSRAEVVVVAAAEWLQSSFQSSHCLLLVVSCPLSCAKSQIYYYSCNRSKRLVGFFSSVTEVTLVFTKQSSPCEPNENVSRLEGL